MDSIAGKTEQLTNEMQSLWNNVLDSGVIKWFLDAALGVTKLVNAIGPLGTALAGVLVYLTAFKKQSLKDLFGGMLANIQNYQQALVKVNTFKDIGLNVGVTGNFNTEAVNAYAAAISGLTAKKQAEVLATNGLNQAQITEIMTRNGVDAATIKETLSKTRLTTEKTKLHAITVQEALATQLSGDAMQKRVVTDFLAANSSKKLTAELLAQMVQQGILTQQQAAHIASNYKLAASNNIVSGSLKSVGLSLKTAFAANPVGFVLTGVTLITSVISSIKRAHEEAIRAANEAVDKYKETKKTLADQKQTVDELSSAYKRLSKGVNTNTNKNIDLTTSSYQEYLDVCNDIADMFPNLVTGYDEQGNAILSLKGNVDKLTQAYKDAALAASQAAIKDGDEVMDDFRSKFKDAYYDGYADMIYGSAAATKKLGDAANAKYQAWKNGKRVESNAAAAQVKTLMDAYAQADEDYQDLSEENKSYVNEIISSLNPTTIALDKFKEPAQLYYWIKTNFVDALKDPEISGALDAISELHLKFSTEDMAYKDYFDQVNKYLEQIEPHLDSTAASELKFIMGVETSASDSVARVREILKDDAKKMATALNKEELSIAANLEVSPGLTYTWTELLAEIEKVKNAATEDFDITNLTDVLSDHSEVITEYQKALQKLEKGTFTMNDFMDLIKKYPELAEGVDVSSNAFLGLSRNLKGAVKSSTKSFVNDLEELKSGLIAAGKSTDSIDQLIEAIENMPSDALDSTIQKYSTLSDKIDSARRSQDKLLASMEEKPNEGYETRGEAMEYMKEAMKKGEIGSESNLWNVAEKYGFTYDSAKTINENADALAKFIATREKWFKEDDDGDDRTQDGYSYEGTENFIKDVEAAVQSSEELQKYLTWDYDENAGTLNFDYKNADWDTIVSILSKTKELAGLTSDEFSDLMIQVGQYFGIDWGNYDDVMDHLEGIASGTSDAKTKVKEYGKVMQDYFGDNSDIDLATRPTVNADSDALKEWKEYYQYIVDHINSDDAETRGVWESIATNRLGSFSEEEVAAAKRHLEDSPDKYSKAEIENARRQSGLMEAGRLNPAQQTVVFSNESGTKSVVVTPILPDGGVLAPDALEKYAEKLLKGEELDPGVDIKIAEFDGIKSTQQALEFDKALSEAWSHYDYVKDPLQIGYKIDQQGLEGLLEIEAIQDAIITKSDGTFVFDEDAFKKALTDAEYTEDQIDILIDKINTLNEEVFNIDPLNIRETLEKDGVSALSGIKEITRAFLTQNGVTVFDQDLFTSLLQEADYTEEQITSLIEEIQRYKNVMTVSGDTDPLGLDSAQLSANALKTSLGLLGVEYHKWWQLSNDTHFNIEVNDLVTTLKEKGWTDEAIKEYVTKLSETNTDGIKMNVIGIENIDTVIQEANNVPDEKKTDYTITGTGVDALESIDSKWNTITRAKSTDYTITETTIRKTKTEGSASNWRSWFAKANGTAHAQGSWGASKTETALVGELGPELLVRGDKWFTVGEGGAEFTHIKKGDIIFNHKQSKELLENGYVTSRGKAYASGTAYATGSGTFARYEFSGTGGWQQYDVNDKVVESWGNLSGAASKASEAASDAKDEFEETFDWVEVRLEEINEQLDLMNAQLENASDYASKNSIIDQILGVNTNKMDNLTSGIKKYSDYAARLLSSIPSQYREAAQDGAIAITEFVGEADEKTVEAIEKYRDWAQKVADLQQQLEETKTTLRELAIQKIDNAEHSGSVKATVEASQTEKLQNAVDYDEERGLITSSAYYTAMMENSNKTIEYLTSARNEMQKQFNDAVASGALVKWSDEWYESLDKLYQIDSEIDSATTELEEFQNAINDIYWDNFDQLINRLDYLKDETQSLIDLMDSDDMVVTPETDDGWSADQVGWTKEGIASLGLYAQQMEIAEYQSKQYAKAIDDLAKDYKKGLYSENEYLEKLNELKDAQYDSIESYYDAQDAIVDLNKTRIDAIKDGIEKEIDAYSELIEKKKEELDTEKDLYDFQKSAAEGQKNIADIQRKLAALSMDNSASAVAKRRQLESDLREAQQTQEELYYDRSVENQQTALDKELEDFQNEKDAELEKWEEYLTNVELVVSESLGIVQANAEEIGNTLTAKTEEYSLTVSDAILSPWQDGSLAISNYQSTFDTAMSSTTDQLETLKNKWQEVIDKMAEVGNANVTAINKENANYIAATKTQPKTTSKPATNNKKTTQTKAAPSVGGTVTVKKSATHFSSKSGNAKMASFVPGGSYTVYEVSGDQILIGRKGAYTGWVKKSDLQGYAKGTTGVSKDQLAWIDELGDELVMHANSKGKLSFLTKGTSVIPHDITENLMELGQLDPTDILNRSRAQITPSKSVVNNNMEISVDASVGTLIHVEHLDGNNPDEITKIVNKAYDKKIQELNNSLKKFVR